MLRCLFFLIHPTGKKQITVPISHKRRSLVLAQKGRKHMKPLSPLYRLLIWRQKNLRVQKKTADNKTSLTAAAITHINTFLSQSTKR
jgi:hypothetical protein